MVALGLIASSNPCDRALSAKPDGYTSVTNLPKVSLTLLPNVPSCDAITTWSHRIDHQVYLRFLIPTVVIACATYLLNGPMKWGERKKYSQTIGLMKRSRCEWDWTLTYRLALRSMSDLLPYL